MPSLLELSSCALSCQLPSGGKHEEGFNSRLALCVELLFNWGSAVGETNADSASGGKNQSSTGRAQKFAGGF